MRSRTVTAVVGLLLSLAVSAVVWETTGSLLLFLFVPFVPFLFRRRGDDEHGEGPAPERRECPVCGFQPRSPEYEYCPRDGTRLDPPDRDSR